MPSHLPIFVLFASIGLAWPAIEPPAATPTPPTSTPPPAAAPAPPAATPPTTLAPIPLTPLAHIEERGKGPINLILIPGLSCDWRVFDAFMTRNADRYHMYAVTLPGFGGSAAPPLPEGVVPADGRWLTNAENALLQLIDDRKIEKPVLVGHSLGGHLVMRFALHHPDRPRAVVSIDGLPLFPIPSRGPNDTAEARAVAAIQMKERVKPSTDEQWRAGQRKSVGSLVKDPHRAAELAEMCAAVPKDTTVEYMTEMMTSDLRGDLWRMTVPTLTISAIVADNGTQMMEFIRRGIAREFANASPSMQLIYFEDSHHFIMDDHPSALDRAISEFLDGKKPEGIVSPIPAPAQSP